MDLFNKIKRCSLLETLSYYGRLVIWVGFLFSTLVGFCYMPSATLCSLKPVVCFAILLAILVVMKSYFPQYYDNLKWFCTPGNVFLKSWISLFFYVYLIRVPADLSVFAYFDIILWILQCVIGNFFALGIIGGCMSLTFYIVRQSFHLELDKEEFDPDAVDDTDIAAVISKLRESGFDAEAAGISLQDLSPKLDTSSSQTQQSKSTEVLVENPLVTQTLHRSGSSGRINSAPLSTMESRDNHEIVDTFRNLGVSFAIRSSDFNGRGSVIDPRRLSVSRVASIRREVYRPQHVFVNQEISDLRQSFDTNAKNGPVNNVPFGGPGNSSTRTESVEKLTKSSDDSKTNSADKNNDKVPSKDVVLPEGGPFVPSMEDLFWIWSCIACVSFIARLVSRCHSCIVFFQLSWVSLVFIAISNYRVRLLARFNDIIKGLVQGVVIFFPVCLFLVIASSESGFNDWKVGLTSFMTEDPLHMMNSWGAGDFLCMFLSSAIIALAFSTVDSMVQYYLLFPMITPVIWIGCLLIIIEAACLSRALFTPHGMAIAMLTRTVTTPIAVSVAEITGAVPSIVASSTIINAVISYRLAPWALSKLKIENPISRGVSAAVSGTLLGVLAIDENGEAVAAGLGIAAYAVATICYSSILAITSIRDFVVNLS